MNWNHTNMSSIKPNNVLHRTGCDGGDPGSEAGKIACESGIGVSTGVVMSS